MSSAAWARITCVLCPGGLAHRRLIVAIYPYNKRPRSKKSHHWPTPAGGSDTAAEHSSKHHPLATGVTPTPILPSIIRQGDQALAANHGGGNLLQGQLRESAGEKRGRELGKAATPPPIKLACGRPSPEPEFSNPWLISWDNIE
ncbi:hypothetical protein EV426DRAFT_574378 [Tirmania nivea]|nr:hypothetical protein EV426DRAFT_574378 [Tirmania nivea]